MLKTTLLTAAALVAFGATAAHAGSGGGHGGYEHGYAPAPVAGHYGHHRGGYGPRRGYPYSWGWFDYRGRPYCRLAPRKVPIKVWDRRGNSYRKWVWKDVRVCV